MSQPHEPDIGPAEDAGTAMVPRALTPAARRALAEAAARRAAIDAAEAARPPEHHGRGGAEPVRYGDWEVRGLATDF